MHPTTNLSGNRNALSHAMLTALSEEFSRLSRDGSVRAVVLAAEGPAFCAGHDLKEMTAYRAESDGAPRASRTCSTSARR